MKRRGPLITLVFVLGALVLVLSLNDALIPNQAAAPGSAPTGEPGAGVSAKPQAAADVVYAGKDESGEMAVAVAISDGKAVGYLCDGRSVEAWLTGTATAGRVTLEARDDGATIYADVDENGAAGVAVVGDAEFDFDIDEAGPPAGLYRKDDGKTTTGWIILPDGSQVGIANTNGAKQPAPTLDPTSGAADLVTGVTR